MKMILIMYNEALDDEILDLLHKNEIRNYTKWTKVYGQGDHSGPHLGSHVWPKANNVLAVVTEDDKVAAVMEGIRLERTCVAHQGVKAFVLPIEEIT